jgi:5-methylcytosine-specific restriction endonuclease McrA
MSKQELPQQELVDYRRDLLYDKGYMFCERCGRSDQYNYSVHHIFFRSEKPKNKHLHHRFNLILLCHKCHNFLHEHKQERKNLFKYPQTYQLFRDYDQAKKNISNTKKP